MAATLTWQDVPCRLWTGALTSDGYGLIERRHPDGRRWRRLAHRALWEEEFGADTIPSGHQLDHLCRVRPCIEFVHLEVVTYQENIERGRAARDFRCKRDHSLRDGDPNVLYWLSPTTGRVNRLCRACVGARRQERRLIATGGGAI